MVLSNINECIWDKNKVKVTNKRIYVIKLKDTKKYTKILKDILVILIKKTD